MSVIYPNSSQLTSWEDAELPQVRIERSEYSKFSQLFTENDIIRDLKFDTSEQDHLISRYDDMQLCVKPELGGLMDNEY
jgi:hypothetical protein